MLETGEVTQLLKRVNEGDQRAIQQLFVVVYDQLRAKAQQYLTRERKDHTLQATALVNEAFLKIAGASSASWQNRAHFYNAVADAMRKILVDHARKKNAQKRGGGPERMKVDVAEVEVRGRDETNGAVDLEQLDRALKRLRQQDERWHQVVMYRYFAGLSENEIAEILKVSEKTVRRAWQAAKLFLLAEMAESTGR